MKYSLVPAVAFLMMISLLCQPLAAAKERRGSMVEVTMTDGRMVRGELLAVKGHNLIIHDKARDQGFTVNIEQVSKIWIKKKSQFLSGLASGLIAGVGLGAILYACTTERDGSLRAFALVLPSFAAIPTGALIGVLKGLSVKMHIRKDEPVQIEECLRYLQKHARSAHIEPSQE